jgi:hypothetical protein
VMLAERLAWGLLLLENSELCWERLYELMDGVPGVSCCVYEQTFLPTHEQRRWREEGQEEVYRAVAMGCVRSSHHYCELCKSCWVGLTGKSRTVSGSTKASPKPLQAVTRTLSGLVWPEFVATDEARIASRNALPPLSMPSKLAHPRRANVSHHRRRGPVCIPTHSTLRATMLHNDSDDGCDDPEDDET